MAADDDDLAMAAYRDEGRWQVVELRPGVGEDLETLSTALARFPSDVGVLGMVVGENALLLVRTAGGMTKALLSDGAESLVWPIAEDVADVLDLPDPDDDVLEPLGSLDILGDLGVTAEDMLRLCLDEDLWPEEMLGELARKVGFGEELEAILE